MAIFRGDPQVDKSNGGSCNKSKKFVNYSITGNCMLIDWYSYSLVAIGNLLIGLDRLDDREYQAITPFGGGDIWHACMIYQIPKQIHAHTIVCFESSRSGAM